MHRQGAVKGKGAKGKVHTYLGQAKFKPPPGYTPIHGKYLALSRLLPWKKPTILIEIVHVFRELNSFFVVCESQTE